VKASSPMNGFMLPNSRSHSLSARRFATAILTGALGIVFSLCNEAVLAMSADACKATTTAAAKSCNASAKSDYSLALGICANIADPATRKACQDQAKTDLQDALQTCKDQSAARQAVCTRLGPATFEPMIDPSNFVATIDNPLMPLIPGTTFVYVDKAGTGDQSNVVAVTDNTKVILGVTCVEVHDTVYTNDVLIEDTRDWFAQDTAGNVWYFGENSQELEDGLPVSLEGSWTGGVDGAQPGIVMKANPVAGDFYRQEFWLGTAEDIAEVADLTNSVMVPFGSFTNCLRTIETSPLEPDALENKFYKAGVGQLLTIDLVTGEQLELVQVITN
jgi:hypothetical protein